MSNVRGLFPRVGLKGRFTFSGPYGTKSDIEMEVIADKTFEYHVSRGRDIFSEVYQPNDISEDVFNDHRNIGVRIITLRYHGTLVIDIPSFYIKSIPDDIVGYNWFQIIASLGILPSNIDLTRVKESVEQVLLSDMGITSTVLVSTSDLSDNISLEDLETGELVRKNAITNTSTLLKDKMMLERRVADLQGQVDHLMNIIYDANIRP